MADILSSVTVGINTYWSIVFAALLSFVTYWTKFFLGRSLNQVSYISGIIDLPTSLIATFCSLSAAYLSLAKANAKTGSVFLLFCIMAFGISVIFSRYVDAWKLTIPGNKAVGFKITAAIAIAYAMTAVLGVNLAVMYGGLQ